ncbi:NF-X1 finger and helicase domain protein [Venturia nashicola]|nr:NF-X1 finger and helicase domain protein [Venturia nashicola]
MYSGWKKQIMDPIKRSLLAISKPIKMRNPSSTKSGRSRPSCAAKAMLSVSRPPYEVDMVFALVRHLVRQGVYRSSDIAVLTPYLGQLRKLRLSLSSFAEVMINDRDTEDLSLDGDNGSIEETSSSSEARLAPRPGVHMGTLLQALRLATVDNFQGMDASSTIIIKS